MTIKDRFAAIVPGMTDHRSNAFDEAMNGNLQQTRRAARGYGTSENLISIAYLRISRLRHLPNHPFAPGAAR
jgi:transposase